MNIANHFRQKARWLKYAARPGKLMRTFLYHAHYYKITRKTTAGFHIGSGGVRVSEFLNIDADAAVDCDLVSGAERLKVADQTVGVIYASHLFEHIPRARARTVLQEWHRVLRVGGHLYLCVPDLEALAEEYTTAMRLAAGCDDCEQIELLHRVIFGAQSDAYDFHYDGYCFHTLRKLLESSGFQDVERFDRQALQFAPFTDCGTAMINGKLVSLNVRATRSH